MSAKPVLIVAPLHEPTMQKLEAQFDCHRLYEASDRDAMLATLADTVQVVATMSGVGIDVELMKALPKLKLACNFGVGIDPINTDDCSAHGVTVCNTPDVLTEDVADMAIGLLLSALRQIPQGDRYVREGQWLKANMALTASLQGRNIGVVGLGRIGRAIARRCEAFNTPIAYTGPNQKKDVAYEYHADIVTLAHWADALIVACPGGPATEGLVSAEAMTALGPEAVLVNIARGSVVDQPALIQLLQSGQLGGAGLDVFANEPKVPAELINIEHIVLQPHQGSASVNTRMAMGQLVVDNIAAWFDKKPLLTPVN